MCFLRANRQSKYFESALEKEQDMNNYYILCPDGVKVKRQCIATVIIYIKTTMISWGWLRLPANTFNKSNSKGYQRGSSAKDTL